MSFIAAILTGIIMLITIGLSIKADRDHKPSPLLSVLAALSSIMHLTALIIFFAQAG